jgi:hypothetical protein
MHRAWRGLRGSRWRRERAGRRETIEMAPALGATSGFLGDVWGVRSSGDHIPSLEGVLEWTTETGGTTPSPRRAAVAVV